MSASIQSVISSAGDLNVVTELLKEHWEEPFEELMERDNTVLNFFSRKEGKGEKTMWKAHNAGNANVGPYAEGADWNDPDTQGYIEAEIPFTHNQGVVQVTGSAIAASRDRSAMFVDLLTDSMEETIEDLKNEINNQLLGISTAGAAVDRIGYVASPAAHGFPAVFAETGNYAGLARTNGYWQPLILDNSSTPRALAISLMQGITEPMFEPDRYGANISTILTAKKHQNQYGNLLTAYRRYVGETTLDYGVTALEFEGIPVVAVPALPAGSMYFLDESTWNYYVWLNFEAEPVATQGDTVKFAIKHYSQLVCKSPAKNAALIDLS